MSEHSDSLIFLEACREAEVAAEASQRAAECLADRRDGLLFAERKAYMEFDRWLRADGNRRNPGTTADLITACLFGAMVRGSVWTSTVAGNEPADDSLVGRRRRYTVGQIVNLSGSSRTD